MLDRGLHGMRFPCSILVYDLLAVETQIQYNFCFRNRILKCEGLFKVEFKNVLLNSCFHTSTLSYLCLKDEQIHTNFHI